MRRRALLVGLITGARCPCCMQPNCGRAGSRAHSDLGPGPPGPRAPAGPPGRARLSRRVQPAVRLGRVRSLVGPRYEERGNPGNAGLASLNWSVTFDQRQGDAEAVSLANVSHTNWARDQRGGLSVPHLVGNRNLGTILGYYVMVSPSAANDARFEGVLAFPLDANLHAVVRYEALEPPADSFLVKGSVVGKSWNRGQVLLALNGVRLQGNLPPKDRGGARYGARPLRAGQGRRSVPGRGPGGRVSLERRSGGSWTKVSGGKTTSEASTRCGRRGAGRTASPRAWRASPR